MSSFTLPRRTVAAVAVASLATASFAPAIANATTAAPAPSASQRGIFDDFLSPILQPVLGILDGVTAGTPLGSTQISTLVNGILQNVDATVSPILTSLTPPQVQQLLATLSGSSAKFGSLLGGVLSMVQGVVGQVQAGTVGAGDITSLVSQLQTLLQGNLLGQATSLFNAIPGSGAALGSLANVTKQLTAVIQAARAAGLPGLSTIPGLDGLLDLLVSKTSVLPTELQAPVSDLVSALRSAKSGSAATTASPAAVAAATAGVARATVTSVKAASSRRAFTVKIALPASASAPAASTVFGSVRGKRVVKKTVTLAPGAVATVKGKIPASLAKKLKKSGGKVVVKVKTAGSTSGAVTKTLAVKKAR